MNSSQNKNFFLAALPLFLILFIDGMGLGLVFPILTAVIMDPNSSYVATNLSMSSRNFIYGSIISIFMVSWFFGSAFLGDLSDQIGRKKALLISLIGSLLGYLLSAFSISLHSLSLMILGRILAGITAGSQSIAQAATIDISEEQHKARNIGYIIFANTLGFVFGPLIGGFFSNAQLISWFSFATPFYVAAILSLINALCLLLLFKETFYKTGNIKLKLHRAIEIFISGFKNEKVRDLAIVLLIFVSGWSCFYTFISNFLLHQYHFTNMHIDIYLALLAIGFGIGSTLLVNLTNKIFTLKKTVFLALILSTLIATVTVTIHNPYVIWLTGIIMGSAVALGYSIIITLLSNQVDADSQGWIMGIASAIVAVGFGFSSFFVSLLTNISTNVPIFLSGIIILISSFFMWYSRNS